MNIESFERSFGNNSGSCRADCACGRVFYDSSREGGWDWEEGEFEGLQADPDATGLDYTVSYTVFEDECYVVACDCWHERAKKVMGFIDDHAHQIAQYLKYEKERKTAEADLMPTV